jgi:hypothetical protein
MSAAAPYMGSFYQRVLADPLLASLTNTIWLER